jgi:hypothetical protein
MRTTLSLDPDVAAMIERELSEHKTTLKALVNEKLRKGFAASTSSSGRRSFDLPKSMDLGKPLLKNLDNVAEILELIERDSNRS